MQKLSEWICASFQSVTAEFTAFTGDQFTPQDCDLCIPESYIISVTDVEKELKRVRTRLWALTGSQTGYCETVPAFSQLQSVHSSTLACVKAAYHRCGNQQTLSHCPR